MQGLSAIFGADLPPQTLVDLLQHPCCVGEARRLVLDQLARNPNDGKHKQRGESAFQCGTGNAVCGSNCTEGSNPSLSV